MKSGTVCDPEISRRRDIRPLHAGESQRFTIGNKRLKKKGWVVGMNIEPPEGKLGLIFLTIPLSNAPIQNPMRNKKTGVTGSALLPAFLLMFGCVVYNPVIEPGYWPDAYDGPGILVSRSYMDEAVDDAGRRWMIPGTGSNFLYRLESNGKDISEFQLDHAGSKLAVGAGFVWVIPENIDPDDKVVWITPSNTRSDRLYRIELESGEVNAEISLPVPFGLADIDVGQEYVWIYGRKKVAFLNLSSHKFLVAKIDATSLQVIGTYELPNPVPLDDGRKIRPLIEPQLLVINEVGYLLLAYWPKQASEPGQRIIVKSELDTGKYSELSWPLKRADLCSQSEKYFLTKRGMSLLGAGTNEISCL